MTLLTSLNDVPADVRARFRSIAGRFRRDGRGCVHLEHVPLGFVCVQHPALVRCRACFQQHIAAHTRHEEHACDMCGDDFEFEATGEWHLNLQHFQEIDTTVSVGRGRRAAVGIVVLSGWGACSGCVPVIDTAAN